MGRDSCNQNEVRIRAIVQWSALQPHWHSREASAPGRIYRYRQTRLVLSTYAVVTIASTEILYDTKLALLMDGRWIEGR